MRPFKTNKNSAALMLLTASCFASSPLLAGGLWLNEFGSPAMGRANAGAEAGEDDASASLHNLASMSRIKDEQIMASGGLIHSEVEFKAERASLANGTDNGGDAGDTAPMASVFYTLPIDDKWAFGISAAGITGAELEYDSGWIGRYQTERVSLVGLAVTPGASYQVNDWLSLGAGVVIMYTELEMDIAIPNLQSPVNGPDGSAELDGDDVVFGGNLSALMQLNDRTRLGLVYQSELDPEYGGSVKIDAEVGATALGVDTELTLSSRIYAGLKHQFNDDINLYASLGWEDWSAMDKVNLTANGTGQSLDRNWEDTYHYAIGADLQVSDRLLLQTGLAYDTSPVDKEDRTADMPIDRQVRLSFGAQYETSKTQTIGAQIVFADYGSGRISTDGIGRGPGVGVADGFDGKYDTNNIIFFSVNANWILGK